MDMKEQSGLSVSTSTIQKAFHEKGLRSYREQWKFILDEENRTCRVRWCEARQAWTMEDCAHIGFTNGLRIALEEKKAVSDCNVFGYVLVTPAILFYLLTNIGMIGYEWRGPCHVWIVETEREKAESIKEIEEINKKHD